MISRFSLITTAILGAYAALFFRLYTLQIQRGDLYIRQVDAEMSGVSSASRGTIYVTDKNGKVIPAATTKDFPTIYATPRAVDDAPEAANLLAPVMNVPVATLLEHLSKTGDDYELLARKVDGSVARDVADLKVKGIYVKDAAERYYPFGTFAAHVLGFVAPNAENDVLAGRYGLEQLYNKELAGSSGAMKGGVTVAPEQGRDIRLTLDPTIQIEAEHVLQATVEGHKAIGGSVIVADPKTGKIFAMASMPTFDPNTYGTAELSDFINPSVQQLYEPGSVMKVLTMSAGIDAGKITPQTTYYDSGVLLVSGRKIQNWDHLAHGLMTMTNVIEKSLNTGAAFAERQTGHETFRAYLDNFGLGEKTGIDLPGEVSGDLHQLSIHAPEVAYATASYGQGVATTPIELVAAVAAIANGGTLMRPYVNADLKPQVIRRVMKEESAREVTEMMVSAVDKAEVAHIGGYTVAGKTGTAFIPDFVHGGYTDDVIHTYIGFGPTADPKFIVLLKIDKPYGAPLAGVTVVPAFRDLAQFLLNYWNVPPDRAEKK